MVSFEFAGERESVRSCEWGVERFENTIGARSVIPGSASSPKTSRPIPSLSETRLAA
jgi:hypothetical protein